MPNDIVITDNRHIVQIATMLGYADWHTLWDENAALKAKRQNPLILFHGDRDPNKEWVESDGTKVKGNKGDVVVPKPITPKEVSGGTNAHHSFKVTAEDVCLRLRVLDENFKPVKDATYELVVDGTTYPKATSKDSPPDNKIPDTGLIEVNVRNTAQIGKLVVRYNPPAPPKKTKDWPKDIQGIPGGADVGTYGVQTIYRDGRKCPHISQVGKPWRKLFRDQIGAASAVCSITMILQYLGRNVNVMDVADHVEQNAKDKTDFAAVAFKFKETEDLPKVRALARDGNAGGFAAKLNARIEQNLPTIARVKFKTAPTGQEALPWHHFVVIVGKNKDGQYLMNDPAANDGDGASYPKAANVVETTTRSGGYTIESIHEFNVVDPPPKDTAATTDAAPAAPTDEAADTESKEEKPPEPVEVEFHLSIGALNPIGDPELAPDDKCVAGVQQRLNNIAFDAGEVDGVLGDHTKAAIKRFQRRFQMPTVDGESSRDMQTKLRDFHDKDTGTAPPIT